MKFGMPLFGLSPRYYADVAAAAEESGFESVWIPDHLVFPAEIPPQYPYTESGLPQVPATAALFDPWVALAYVAHATTTIRLATSVYILPLRHPIVTARSVLTLDRVSNGRVTMGVGVGWLEPEFDAVGQSFATRGRRTDEIIEVLRRLWTEPVIEHSGAEIQFGPVRMEPKPRQRPTIPIEIGGSSPAALRRAGRLGDGWLEIGCRSVDDVGAKLRIVERHREECDRQALPFEVTVGGEHFGADDIRRLQEIGVTRMIQGAPARATTKDAVVDWIHRFGDETIRSEQEFA